MAVALGKGVKVLDLAKNEVELASLWANKPVVLSLAQLLVDIKPEIDQLGASLVAVGTGSPNFAKKFQEGLPFPGEVYRDPEAKAFKQLNLPRLGMLSVMARFFLSPSAISFYNGLKGKYAASDMEGDGQQTGGVFVISPEGKILYSFKENDADPETFADNKAIIDALKKYAESHPPSS